MTHVTDEYTVSSGEKYISLGDHISLFCTDTRGFVFTDRNGSSQNSVYVYTEQDQEKPENIPNPQVATFQVVTQNRYKLNKKYRRLKELVEAGGIEEDTGLQDEEDSQEKHDDALQAAKRSAEAEEQDNSSELRRLRGRPVTYGDVVQLKHIFTQKYIHVDHNQTSIRDKSKLEVNLLSYNGKTAQFKIRPKYKVNTDGEMVRHGDQVTFESVKIPGQFLNASPAFDLPYSGQCCEINLAVQSAEFTILSRFQHGFDDFKSLWGGAVIQLYHRDLEGYLSADGDFTDGNTEEVHLRIRYINFLIPKTLYPSTSCTTFWQVEAENSSMNGTNICWGSHMRIRHLNTRLYLAFRDGKVLLTKNPNDPNTVFMFRPLHKEEGPVAVNSSARIQHVMNQLWLHGDKENYSRISQTWDTTERKQVSTSNNMLYADAFKVSLAEPNAVSDHNFVSGATIFISDITELIKALKESDDPEENLDTTVSDQGLELLQEIKTFMTEPVPITVDRRKLLREMMLIDKMLELALTISESIQASSMDLSAIYEQVMIILYNYVSWKSDKSSEAVHLIQYLDFFISQLSHKNGVGFVVSRLLVELIKDRPRVIDSLTENHIDSFVSLARKSNSPRYLQLLGAVSVCENVARSGNQSRICQRLLNRNKLGILRFTLEEAEVHVTRVNAASEAQEAHVKLSTYLNPASLSFTENKEYLLEEIALLEKLCHGRNQECIYLLRESVIDWNILFHIIQHSSIAHDIQAHFVQLLIVLYIDVGENTSLLEQTLNICRYDNLDVNIDFSAWLLQQVVYSDPQLTPKLPQLKAWLSTFVEDNKQVIASRAKTNKFILSVLELMIKLTMYGYLTPTDLSAVTEHLAYILDGRNDLPDERSAKLSLFMRRRDNLVLRYQNERRFYPEDSTQIVLDIKFKIMEFFEYILRLCDEFYVVKLAAHFKVAVNESRDAKKPSPLVQLLRPHTTTNKKWFNDPIKAINEMMDSVLSETSTIVNKNEITDTLMDVSHYKYDRMMGKAIQLLSHLYNCKARMVSFALETQLLLTQESLALHHDICTFMPLFRRVLLVHIRTDQAEMVNAILEKFMECCAFKNESERPNKIGQHCLVNHGLVTLLMELLQRPQIKDPPKAGEEWFIILASNIMKLLRLMVRNNPEVQDTVFKEIDTIMAVRSCPASQADMLCELFHHNADVSWKVSDTHVHQLVALVSEHQEKVPQLVKVLTSIIVADDQGTLIKRSQTLVMKHVLRGYPKDAYVFDIPPSRRCLILMGDEEKNMLQYTVNLINLLTLCAKGNRGSIRSFCQNVFTLREILTLLLKEELSPNIKCHLLGYVTWVYLHLMSASDKSTIGNPLLKRMIWQVIKSFMGDFDFCNELVNTETVTQAQLASLEFSSTPRRGDELYPAAVVYYIVDAILPFIKVFSRTFTIDNVNNPEEYKTIQSILFSIKSLLPWCASIIRSKAHEDNIRSIMQLITGYISSEDEPTWEAVRISVERNFTLQRHSRLSTYQKGGIGLLGQTPEDEAKANRRFRVFMRNARKAILRPNTIQGQLGIGRGHIAKKPYLPKEEVGRLPLTVGFQEQVGAYINGRTSDFNTMYYSILPLIDHLKYSGHRARLYLQEASEQEVLVDIKCIQIIRTILYNEIVMLPDYWEENAGKYQRRLKNISKLQTFFVERGFLSALFMLLNRRDKKLTGEVIMMIYLMFFNANFVVQDAALDYFKSTREEVFFLIIEELFFSSAMMLKERRSLQAQMRKSSPVEDPDLAKEEEEKKVAGKMSQIFSTVGVNGVGKSFGMVEMGKKIMKFPSPVEENDPAEAKQKLTGVEVLKDDDIITVVLKMIAASSDGQHRAMQNYLRNQPDNLRSVNLVAVTTQYLGVLCNSINPESLPLILQVFLTLLEIIQGNQENRLVVLNNKLIDYINLVLRNNDIISWAPVELHRLRGAIAECLIALLEESTSKGTNGVNIAKEVATQLDLGALLKVIEDCYKIVKWRWWSSFRKKKRNSVDILNGIDPTPNVIEEVKAIGKKYVISYNQLLDAMSQEYVINEEAHPNAKKALDFFRPYIASVEILKDNSVHRVYFCVSEKSDIRVEIKERLKWNIDRSSSSNKLRDFLVWSRLIIRDIMYTRKVLSNPFARFCTNQWTMFNNLCIILSIAINALMLVTWTAPASGADVDSENPNQTVIQIVKDPMPNIAIVESYDTVLLGLGISHNVLSCLLIISYFLTTTPSFPKPQKLVRWFRQKCSRGHHTIETTADKAEESSLEVKTDAATAFFSFKTMYYILFVVASFAGTFTMGYFFAFHLLNIVNVNVLLRHVIKAVTLNGSSLIWVAILGLVLLYIYSLVAFAFFRLSFVPADFGYCRTLYECAVTIIRFGLVGDIDENFKVNGVDLTFPNFTYVAIYQVTFFIIFTTILLNIIFGIIVDTFSELRDLKWHAEKDMQENCFICGRQAYEFEHHAKGFRHHVQFEHNQWTYIFYFLYLCDTNPTDYTSIDIYVSELLKSDHYDFFPIDRALSLSALEGEEGESKIDALARDIRFLVVREKHRITEDELDRLDRQQKEWRQLIRVKDAIVEKHLKKAGPSLRKRLDRIRAGKSKSQEGRGQPHASSSGSGSDDPAPDDATQSQLGQVEHSIPL